MLIRHPREVNCILEHANLELRATDRNWKVIITQNESGHPETVAKEEGG